MNVVPLPIARVSDQLRGSLLLGNLQSGQVDLLKVEQQISTGQRLSQASDDPAAALGIQRLRAALAASDTYNAGLTFAGGFLTAADSSLSALSGLLTQAQQIASAQAGTTASADERAAQAAVVDSLLAQALNLANARYQNAAVFGGANSTQDPFAAAASGYVYQGATQAQALLTDTGASLEFSVDGNAVFGGLSAGVTGTQDLAPWPVGSLQLSDMAGVRGQGVHPGIVLVQAGGMALQVDLSHAATVNDVVSGLQNALTVLGSGATIATWSGQQFGINNPGTSAVTLTDISGSLAADLGLARTIAAGTAAGGGSVHPQLTALTPLSALRGGAGLDPSGMQITNGAVSATITTAGLSTVQDLLNAINNSGTHVRAQINAAGTGIDVFNTLSGAPLRIGENGGATATQLGIRSFTASTPLAQLNSGRGVTPIAASGSGATDDFQITRQDGSSFTVSLQGCTTVQDVLDAIHNASGNTTPATQVVAALAATGNGIVLTDPTTGSNTLTLTVLNASPAAGQLGWTNAAVGNTITGTDVNPIETAGVFSSLLALRNALHADDTAGIQRAAAALQADAQRVIRLRGVVGSRAKDISARQDQVSNDQTQLKSSLATLAGTDMASAISKFQALQTAYEGSLRVAQSLQQLSLLDFLN